jgi:hypothetical protein
MALSQAANLVEKAVGHTGDTTTEQNMTNPARDRERYADPSTEKMKALVWIGKNTVQVVETPKPRKIEDTTSLSKSLAARSAAATCTCSTAPSSRCRRVISSATSSAGKSTASGLR